MGPRLLNDVPNEVNRYANIEKFFKKSYRHFFLITFEWTVKFLIYILFRNSKAQLKMLYQNCTILNDKFVIFVYQLKSIIFQGDELMTYCKYDTMGRKYGVAVSMF